MDFFNDLVILLTTFSLKEARGSTEDNRIWAIDTSSDKKIRIRILDLKLTSTPIRAWEVKLEIMTDRPTDGHTGGHREVSLPIIMKIVFMTQNQ